MKEPTATAITLYNVLEQRVQTLYEGTPSAAETQTLHLLSRDLSSGVYFLRMRAGGHEKTRRLTVVE